MDSVSKDTFSRIEQNDPSTTELIIPEEFNSSDGDDFSRLGTSIAANTHLTKLLVYLSDIVTLSETNKEFYAGLKRNSGIHELVLYYHSTASLPTDPTANTLPSLIDGVGHEILKVYQTNKNLTNFDLGYCNLAQGGDQIIANTFRKSTNLKSVYLSHCGINDEQIVTIFEAIRGHTSLVDLSLTDNAIGNRACETIAALLEDPHCNLCLLNLYNNEIDIEGATILVNSLANNTKLKKLILSHNPIDQSSLLEVLLYYLRQYATQQASTVHILQIIRSKIRT